MNECRLSPEGLKEVLETLEKCAKVLNEPELPAVDLDSDTAAIVTRALADIDDVDKQLTDLEKNRKQRNINKAERRKWRALGKQCTWLAPLPPKDGKRGNNIPVDGGAK